MRKTLVIAAFLLYAGAIRGDDGNDLVDKCRAAVNDGGNDYAAGFCGGLVFGVSQHVPHSIPAEVTLGQLTRVVYKYLQDHPEELRMADYTLIRRAIWDAWPPTQAQRAAFYDYYIHIRE